MTIKEYLSKVGNVGSIARASFNKLITRFLCYEKNIKLSE